MIIKERTIPEKILILEALLRRLQKTHPKIPQIESELAKSYAGYRGEQSIDYHLTFLPEKDYLILQDLRLSNGKYFFQMDTLLLSQYYALVIEIKNIAGTLFFDQQFHQLIRTNSDSEDGFADPILQAINHKRQFSQWLEQHKMEPLPVEYIVAVSNPSTIIKTNPGNALVLEKVCHAAFLLQKIKCFNEQNPKVKYDMGSLKKLAKLLVKKHTPLQSNILQKLEIEKSDIIIGVRCPECSSIPMKYERRTWVCPRCQHKSKDAHIEAIQDYFLLINIKITAHQFREYLRISSISAASKLLTSMDLPYTGERKGRVYHNAPY